MMEFTFDGLVRHGFGFYNPNHAAAFICLLFPFLWGWKKYGALGWAAAILLTFPLVLTYSRTGALVLIFELVAYFFLTRNKNWKLIAAVAGGSLFILAAGGVFARFAIDGAVVNRPEIWLAGLKLYAKNPLGVGIGNSGLVVSNLMLENIQCRTLVNSYLTLLAECGLFAGLLWFGAIFYALLHGRNKSRTWCAFAGLCLSATCSSVFDWDLLTDFRTLGGLPLPNFILSWMLLLVFLAMMIYLIRGRICIKQCCIAAVMTILTVTAPFSLWNPRTPKVDDNIIYTAANAPLILYDEQWTMKTILPYCGKFFRLPMHPGFVAGKAEILMLFGNASEYASRFPESRIIYVHPPEIFTPPANTVRIVPTPHDDREFSCGTRRR